MKRKLLSSILSISLLAAVPVDIAFGEENEEQINYLQESAVTEEETANSKEKQVYVPGIGYVNRKVLKRAVIKDREDNSGYIWSMWFIVFVLSYLSINMCYKPL